MNRTRKGYRNAPESFGNLEMNDVPFSIKRPRKVNRKPPRDWSEVEKSIIPFIEQTELIDFKLLQEKIFNQYWKSVPKQLYCLITSSLEQHIITHHLSKI